MTLRVRPVTTDDIAECGRIIYCASTAVNAKFGYTNIEFPQLEVGLLVAKFYISHPGFYGVVAVRGEQLLGCAFSDERGEVTGIATVAVDPDAQGSGVGRQIMQSLLHRASDVGSVRLLQHAFNPRSLALYTLLGFQVRQPIVLLCGRVDSTPGAGCHVRKLYESDLPACRHLCERIFGFSREGELRDALRTDSPHVAIRDGDIVAYIAGTINGHGVARTESDMCTLIAGLCASLDQNISILVPGVQSQLFSWCLSRGMTIEKPLTLMSLGDYTEPRGCYLTSISF